MSDVLSPALSPMPILKMEGGGVMPMTAATSVIHQPVMGQVRVRSQVPPESRHDHQLYQVPGSPSPLLCPPSIIAPHPAQQIQLLAPPGSASPANTVPSLVNEENMEGENGDTKDLQNTQVIDQSIEAKIIKPRLSGQTQGFMVIPAHLFIILHLTGLRCFPTKLCNMWGQGNWKALWGSLLRRM